MPAKSRLAGVGNSIAHIILTIVMLWFLFKELGFSEPFVFWTNAINGDKNLTEVQTLFFCVALILILWPVYRLIRSVLKYMSPIVHLEVESLAWTLGSTQRVYWSLQGKSSIKSLQLDLRCKEFSAPSSSRNDIHREPTAEAWVAEIPLLRCENIGRSGEFTFEVPTGLMPSFPGKLNSINWYLGLRTTGSGSDANDYYQVKLLAEQPK